MTIFFAIMISILSILLGCLVYRLIKLDNHLKIEKMRGDAGWEQYHEMEDDRDALNDALDRKNSEISSLKKELSSLRDINFVPVTRIETYTPEMKVLKYSVELCQSDFGVMTKEQVIELAKDELYKNLFEIIKPYISVFETDDIYYMRTTVSGKIVVEDRERRVEG